MLNYECSVNDTLGIGTTIWLGDAFECMDTSNQIRLTHSEYDSGQSGVCGDYSAESIGVNGTRYISRLSSHSSMLNETTINCTLSGVVVVETVTLKIEG